MTTQCNRIRTGLLLTLALLTVYKNPIVTVVASGPLQLEKVYTYRNKLLSSRTIVDFKARLDPSGKYLYVMQESEGRVWVVDWRNNKVIREADLSGLPCEWYDPEQLKSRRDKPIFKWEFVPKTNWLFLHRCSMGLLIDSDTFQLVRTIINPSREKGRVFFSPEGDFAAVARFQSQHEKWSLELRRVESWEHVAEWPSAGPPFGFTPDGKYVVELSNSREAIPPSAAGKGVCSMTFYEVPSGKAATRWEHSEAEQACPYWTWSLLTKGEPYRLVAWQTGPSYKRAIHVWDAWTGKLLRVVEAIPYSLGTLLSITPDGQYVVSGTWDDPQDNPVSADFTIWNLDSGEIAYQTKPYRSKWGPSTVGTEVYPSFSVDGRHLIAVTPKGIDIYEIINLPEEMTSRR